MKWDRRTVISTSTGKGRRTQQSLNTAFLNCHWLSVLPSHSLWLEYLCLGFLGAVLRNCFWLWPVGNPSVFIILLGHIYRWPCRIYLLESLSVDSETMKDLKLLYLAQIYIYTCMCMFMMFMPHTQRWVKGMPCHWISDLSILSFISFLKQDHSFLSSILYYINFSFLAIITSSN